MKSLKKRWSQIPAHKRRYAAMGAAGAGAVLLLWFFAASDAETDRGGDGQKIIENVLTDDDTRNVGIDALSARMEKLAKENDELKREQQRLKKEASNGQRPEQNANTTRIDALERALEKANKDREALSSRIKNRKEAAEPADREKQQRKQARSANERNRQARGPIYNNPGQRKSGFDADEVFKTGADSTSAEDDKGGGEQKKTKPPKIMTIAEETDDSSGKDRDGDDDNRSYLPAGSIITVTTMSGFDAPTGQAARRDPLPALMRIKHEAILPNRFRQDVKECFLLASGYGDLSSERAYMRAETLSCVRQDGGVIEQKVEAFATGEDGKAGVRGRLVSKQGAIIAKSLMAGFLSGASKAFDVNPVPTINTTNTGEQQYQKVFSSNSLQGAAVSGASDALDRIAKFYIEMAESMYPVIEVNAGRKISFIIQSGVSLDAEK